MKNNIILIVFCLFQSNILGEKLMNEMQKATFGAGCFWCVEAVFERLDGVKDVMPGYTGGHKNNPTYKDALLDIFDFFEAKINFCLKQKYKKELIVLDPGIGFGKNLDDNLRLMSKI